MEIENSQEYLNAMLQAFIGKDDKVNWYKSAFSKYNINGVDTMQWNWSWWAFSSGFLFLLYRKQYIPAAILFVVSTILSALVPFISWIIISILSGGYATYFIYKGYQNKLSEIETKIKDKKLRIETMKTVGGYNSWVVWLYVVFTILILAVLLAYIGILGTVLF